MEAKAATDQDLIDRYIEPDPMSRAPSRARLGDYGVSVWALVAYWKAANGDIQRVATDYDLPCEAVEAALAYYRRYKVNIDGRIADHDAAFS